MQSRTCINHHGSQKTRPPQPPELPSFMPLPRGAARTGTGTGKATGTGKGTGTGTRRAECRLAAGLEPASSLLARCEPAGTRWAPAGHPPGTRWAPAGGPPGAHLQGLLAGPPAPCIGAVELQPSSLCSRCSASMRLAVPLPRSAANYMYEPLPPPAARPGPPARFCPLRLPCFVAVLVPDADPTPSSARYAAHPSPAAPARAVNHESGGYCCHRKRGRGGHRFCSSSHALPSAIGPLP